MASESIALRARSGTRNNNYCKINVMKVSVMSKPKIPVDNIRVLCLNLFLRLGLGILLLSSCGV